MDEKDRRRIRLIVAVALLVLAAFLGILAVAVTGGFWLIILAILCLVGVVVADRVSARWLSQPASPAEEDEPAPSEAPARGAALALLAVAVVGIFLLLLLAIVRLVNATGSGPIAIPPAVTSPGTGESPRTSPSPQPSLAPSQRSQSPLPPSQQYVTAGTDVHLRAAATTDSPIVTTMPAFATSLTLICYQPGEVVFSEPYWYRVSYDGLSGYVSSLWLDAGADPARTSLPHC